RPRLRAPVPLPLRRRRRADLLPGPQAQPRGGRSPRSGAPDHGPGCPPGGLRGHAAGSAGRRKLPFYHPAGHSRRHIQPHPGCGAADDGFAPRVHSGHLVEQGRMESAPVMAMVIRRIMVFPVLLLCSAGLVFFLAWVSPYDPTEAYVMSYGPDIGAELRRQYAEVWELDRPAHQQFFQWLKNLVMGDWGQSRLLGGQPVWEAITARLGPSAVLVGAALILVFVWGLAAGILAAAF